MVCVAGQRHVVVGIQLQVVLHKALGSVLLALVFKLCGALAEVVVQHALYILLPDGVDLLGIACSDSLDVCLHGREEVGEVEQRVTIRGDGVGHDTLGDETIALHAEDGVIERTALAEACVAMSADVAVGTVGVGLANEERLAQVDVGLAGVLLQNLALQESKSRVAPAGTRVVLVLDAGYGVLKHGGEHERIGLLGHCGQRAYCCYCH